MNNTERKGRMFLTFIFNVHILSDNNENVKTRQNGSISLTLYVDHAFTILFYKYLSCVPGVDGKIHPEGVVQHRR